MAELGKNTVPKNKLDWNLMLTILGLLIIGVSFNYSASSSIALKLTGDTAFFFKRHVIAVAIGIVCAYIAFRINIERVFRFYPYAVFLAIALLCLVFIPGIGKQVSGASRWIKFASFTFQPSEGAKFLLILYLANVLANKKDKIQEFLRGTLPPMLISVLVITLIAIEPDLSTSILLAMVVFFLFFLVGTPLLHLVTVMAVVLPFFTLLVESKRYLIRRFAFFNPFEDPYGSGYHLIQSFLSFQNGKWLGVGPGHSSQKLKKLPEAHTDFVFSIIGEEIGVIGALGIILLFGFLTWQLVQIALKQEDQRKKLFVAGLAILIGLESSFHFFVTLGLMPTTGLPLPFISYGRSAMVMHLFMLGLVLGISSKSRERNPFS